MAFSLALILLLSLVADYLFRRLRMPGLIGMLLVGVVLGPYVLGLIRPELLAVSADLRKIALIVILLRAGLELSKDTLNRVGMRAMLMACLPAILEGVAITLVAPRLLGLGYLEAAILGSIVAAVSPAVVVPLMINFMDRRKGTDKGIPTLLLAASSVDDVFVIVIFSSLMGLVAGTKVNLAAKLLSVPVSILLGVAAGLLVGIVLHRLFQRLDPRATKRVLIILGVGILLTQTETWLENIVPFASLLAVMAIGFIILEKSETAAHEISQKLSKIWVFAEILLFVLVGAQVNIHVAWEAGLAGAAVVGIGLVARSIGTYLCFLRSEFTIPERLFCVVAYIPKATVQAAIGAVPLTAGVKGGELILAVAVLSIILTAPLGAWAISLMGDRVLTQSPPDDTRESSAV